METLDIANSGLQTDRGFCSNRPGETERQTSSDVGYIVNSARLSVPSSRLYTSKFYLHLLVLSSFRIIQELRKNPLQIFELELQNRKTRVK